MKRNKSSINWIRKAKTIYFVVVLVVLAVLVLRLALPGIVKNYVNKQLNELPGYTGHVEDIDIHLIRGAYVIQEMRLKKKTDPAEYPFLYIHQADLSIEWRSLFKGRLVSEIVLDQPKMNILATEEINKEPSKDSWTKTLKALMPITINRLQINRGKLAYLDLNKKPITKLHIDNMQLTALNLANVQKTGKACRRKYR